MRRGGGGPPARFADARGGAAPSHDPGAPIVGFEGIVEERWIDGNRHMTSLAYATLFWNAASPFYHRVGIDASYPTQRRLSIFQRESHIAFERELRLDDPIQVRSWLIAHDARRIHHFHELWHTGTGYRAATMEFLSLHIDLATRRVAPMPDDIMARLDALAAEQARLERPRGTSGQITLMPRDRSAG